MNDLEALRRRIRNLDAAMLALEAERMELARVKKRFLGYLRSVRLLPGGAVRAKIRWAAADALSDPHSHSVLPMKL